ncbi:hypothetical protein PV326_004093 [Microctonus aethiopoides]|nr:hypothetical protein PV326_004093 [Microctonus aethiopoides]
MLKKYMRVHEEIEGVWTYVTHARITHWKLRWINTELETTTGQNRMELYQRLTHVPNCLNRADLIKVHDGPRPETPTIAVLCNQDAEVEVLSTGSDLYVEFVANSEWPGQGFKAIFQFQPLDDTPHSELDKTVPGAVTSNPRYSVIGPAVSATSK